MVSPERHTEKSNNSIVKRTQQMMFLSLPALVRAFDSMYLLRFLIAKTILAALAKIRLSLHQTRCRDLFQNTLPVPLCKQNFSWLFSFWERLWNLPCNVTGKTVVSANLSTFCSSDFKPMLSGNLCHSERPQTYVWTLRVQNLLQGLFKCSACKSGKTLRSLCKYRAGPIVFRPVFHFK